MPETREQVPQKLLDQYEASKPQEQSDQVVRETLDPSEIIWDDFDQHYGQGWTDNFDFRFALHNDVEDSEFDSTVPWTTGGVIADGHVLESGHSDGDDPSSYGPTANPFGDDQIGSIE